MHREDMKYDVRTLKHRIRRRETTPEAIQKHLGTLPDDAAECEPTKTEFLARWEGKTQS